MNIADKLSKYCISIVGRPGGGYITQSERDAARKRNRKKKNKKRK